MRIVRVVCDGPGCSTKVTLEDGSLLEGIVSVQAFIHGPDEMARVGLVFEGVALDITGETVDAPA